VTLSPVQQQILAIAAARREMVLAGNKETYAFLRRQPNGQWLRTEGDTMTQEEDVWQVSEPEVLSAIRSRVREMTGHYGPDDGAVTWDDVLAYLREHPV
jgi:hypothetical protein